MSGKPTIVLVHGHWPGGAVICRRFGLHAGHASPASQPGPVGDLIEAAVGDLGWTAGS